jgi:16S rRNA C967 or C1407 C5-methylase (RsmB/RsmF family)
MMIENAFETHFKGVYGPRWPQLRQSLLSDEVKVSRPCFGGYAHYYLDTASVVAAQALEVKPGDQVLDLCAAPGGKSLILAEMLEGKGLLVANEYSRERRFRLMNVVQEHVPEQYRSLIQITGYDGNQFGLKKANSFDRVLLDAPCSSERHLLQADSEMKDWKESRTKQLSMRQYSLLCSGVLSLKPGGTLVYSTCSISPLENDEVIKKLLKKKGDSVVLDLPPSIAVGERTELGFQIFPDIASGAGPIYFSRIKKR